MDLSRFRLPTIWISSILGGLTFLHMIGVYIYEGGGVIGIPGGSINIGLVGTAPEIPNPMEFGTNKQHDLILSFLFRSLIRYNTEKAIYEGDLGTCDLSNLSKVQCLLSGSGVWSDKTTIQVDDIIATYQAYKENPPNDKMKAFLANVSIVSKNTNEVEISANEKNSLMLDLLASPILRSDMIERIRTGRLSKEGYVTSGAYIFLEKEKNTQYGYERITLARNETNNALGWLDKYNFLFFPDNSALERSADILSVIVPKEPSAKMILGPRFRDYEYVNYEYIGLFLNTDTIKNAVRKNIILQASSALSGMVVKNERAITTPLFPANNNQIKLEKNLSDTLKESGYTKVDEMLVQLEADTGILTGSSVSYEKSIYFDTPSREKIMWSEVAAGEVTLAGNVPTNVKNIFINGYQLQEFRPGNNRFLYKVSLENTTLTEGKNTYTLEFENNEGVKSVRDTITLYYHKDTKKLEDTKKQIEDEYLARLNTPELIQSRLVGVNTEKEKIKALNPRYYYNTRYEPFALKLLYLTEPGSLESYATNISNTLLTLGLKVDIEVMNSKDFSNMLQKGEKNYDMLIIGFEANGRFSRIGQIFLSSEAKKGINFAKIESKNLDALFATLRVSYIQEKTTEIIQNIGDIMQSEAFFLPISSPIHTLAVDRTLKGVKQIDTFQDITTLYNVLQSVSIKEQYVLDTSTKSFFGFFPWLWQKAHF